MKLLIVANTSGGVGKTTLALACAVAATEYGKKVLLIDADPRAALTFACGIENPRVTTKEFLNSEFSLEASMVRTSERFSLLPASSRLSSIELENLMKAEKLRENLGDFDLVIVDTPSAYSGLTNYFSANADLVVIPSTLEILSIRGAVHARDFAIQAGHQSLPVLLLNKSIENPNADILSQLKTDFELLEPPIRFENLVSESQAVGKSFLTTANQSAVAADIREITYSILEKVELI